MQGVFVTGARGREDRAANEVKLLLQEFAQEHFQEEPESGSLEDAFEKEIQDLQSDQQTFYHMQVGIEACSFVRVKKNIPIDSFFHSFIKDYYTKKVQRTRFAQRLVPFSVTCWANTEAIIQALEPLIQTHFSERSFKYAIFPRTRNNNQLDKQQIIDQVAALMQGHTVDLKNPEKAILIETCKNLTGISIVQDYMEFKKFNLVFNKD